MNIEKALEIAIKAHEGQIDKADKAYILHPLRLMNQFSDENSMIVSVLHDVVEDSDYTFQDLIDAGFSSQIVQAVECLTKRENEEYQDFIKRVKVNPLAVKVKIVDIKDNLDISRLYEPLSEKDFGRIQKYQAALKLLEE
jgi:(p)ppGpp synthase/HD superfamily hydrolase